MSGEPCQASASSGWGTSLPAARRRWVFRVTVELAFQLLAQVRDGSIEILVLCLRKQFAVGNADSGFDDIHQTLFGDDHMGCDKRHLKTLELFKTGFNALADGWGDVDDFTGHFDFHNGPLRVVLLVSSPPDYPCRQIKM